MSIFPVVVDGSLMADHWEYFCCIYDHLNLMEVKWHLLVRF